MPTSTRFVVSLHTLAMIARNAGEPTSSESIAADVGTNPAVIRALLSRLASAGLTTSQRGNGGGALLARPVSEITLLDAYLAVEERDIFTFHSSAADDRHSVSHYIFDSVATPLKHAREAMERALAVISLRDIVDDIQRRYETSVTNDDRVQS